MGLTSGHLHAVAWLETFAVTGVPGNCSLTFRGQIRLALVFNDSEPHPDPDKG